MGPAGIFSSFAAQGAPVSSYDDIRELDLRYCDQTVPRRKERYLLIAAGQGAATSLAVTGATVSSTVSGGTTLGVASVAVATDVTAVLVAASPAPTTSSASVDAGRSQNTHCGGGRTSTRPTTSTTHSSAPPTPSRTSTSARLRTGSTTRSPAHDGGLATLGPVGEGRGSVTVPKSRLSSRPRIFLHWRTINI